MGSRDILKAGLSRREGKKSGGNLDDFPDFWLGIYLLRENFRFCFALFCWHIYDEKFSMIVWGVNG